MISNGEVSASRDSAAVLSANNNNLLPNRHSLVSNATHKQQNGHGVAPIPLQKVRGDNNGNMSNR